ncbi:MAG TPA: DUF58 domain-containing protein [Cyclobacteriaceae bacterium]
MKLLRSLYINNRFFQCMGALVALFVTSFIFPAFILVPKILFLILVSSSVADIIVLYRVRKGLHCVRFVPEKLSNGDENEIRIFLENFYPFPVKLNVIDEIPHRFQRRDVNFVARLASRTTSTIRYTLRPVKRGEYHFGVVNVFVSTPLGLFRRRYKMSGDVMVPVYPSFIQMRKYELLAISDRLVESGIKKIRRIGHNMEFEQIKEYVSGDDFRTINWKATARKSTLMVNHYQDERSQQVYSLIDKGRVMQMPFNGMSLLDYAINASLVISNVAIRKSDKAGIVTFQDKIGSTLAAGKQGKQMTQIMEVLYNQKTAFRESDFSVLFTHIRRKINQRSLLLLFTNFESIFGLQRQLPFIKRLAHRHLVVVIFFENTEITRIAEEPATSLRSIYHKTIAEKFRYEKKLIVKELNRSGIQALLTSPDRLTVDTINKYLELKARGMI